MINVTFTELFTNPLVIAVAISLVIAQVTKSIINVIYGKGFSWKFIAYGTGGMPSSHAAVVSSLTISILLTEGITSILILSVIFSLLIIRDAMGVRREAGRHAVIINNLAKKFRLKIPNLKESVGHEPKQVIAGVILGTIVAFLVVLL